MLTGNGVCKVPVMVGGGVWCAYGPERRSVRHCASYLKASEGVLCLLPAPWLWLRTEVSRVECGGRTAGMNGAVAYTSAEAGSSASGLGDQGVGGWGHRN